MLVTAPSRTYGVAAQAREAAATPASATPY
jgi:hypothetical protein